MNDSAHLNRTKTIGACAFLLVVAGLMLGHASHAAQSNTAATALVIEEPVFDAPERLIEGDLLGHVFELCNTGTQAIDITSVRTSCGCVVADFDRTIAPGATGAVTLEFDTKGYRGDVSQKALVVTTDPVQPKRLLQLRVKIDPAIAAKPDRVFLNGFPEDDLTAEVAIVSQAGERLALVLDDEHSQIPQGVGYTLTREQEGRAYRLAITDTHKTARSYRGRLVFDTGSAFRPKLVVPIMGRVKPDVAVNPPMIDFGTLSRKKYLQPSRRTDIVRPELHKTVFIRSNRDEAIAIEQVDIDPAMFDAQVATVVQGRAYRITVTCKPNHIPLGELETEMVVRTGLADLPELRVPLKVAVR